MFWRLYFVLFSLGSVTLVSTLRECYDCNSVVDSECGGVIGGGGKGHLRTVPCDSYAHFINWTLKEQSPRLNLNGGDEVVDGNGQDPFILQPPWAYKPSLKTVCKKMTIKLTSRDPPGTVYSIEESLRELRDAMPLRHLRYCGIESSSTQSHQSGCESRIASGKMDVRVCSCSSHLCNGTQQPTTHQLLLSLLLLLII